MRVIAGKFKGRNLKSMSTNKTRVTLTRVKEAVFSMVAPYILNANVLDLFAGSGSIGIEMLSRGAKFCYFNDIQKDATSTILSNIQLTNTQNYVKISMKDYLKCLKSIAKEEMLFDIIFLDPPYGSEYGLQSLIYISKSKNKILAENGIVIYETDKGFLDDMYDNIENLECITTKFYGKVAVKIYKWR